VLEIFNEGLEDFDEGLEVFDEGLEAFDGVMKMNHGQNVEPRVKTLEISP
jgi:hypothetical protein